MSPGLSVMLVEMKTMIVGMSNIKSRELVRERLVRKDLFQFEERIKNLKELKNLRASMKRIREN